MKWLLIVLVAATYHILGKISFLTALPISPTGPALVWLPTGFAVGAIFLFGFRIWPGIALGSLLNSDFSLMPITNIVGFMLANTLDPMLAAWLTRHLVGREVDLCRPWDVARFILVVSFVSSPLSATLGASAIHFSQSAPSLGFALTWSTWWISDVLSVLVLAPLMLAWSQTGKARPGESRIGEKVLVSALGLGILYLIFSMPFGRDTIHFVYWVFPFIIWYGFRHGMRITTSSIFILSLVTIAATSQGIGPFLGPSVELSFLYVQSFLIISSMTAMVVVALVNERDQAIQNRDEFFMVASHELSTPLTVLSMLSGFLDRLVNKEQLDDMTRPQRVELVKMNSRETQRLSRLVEDLLEGSKISAGKLTLDLALTDLSMIVNDVVKELAEQASQTGVNIYFESSTTPIEGKWDERRLRFVVRTLVANALKFGEGKAVSVSVMRRDSWAKVVVEDRGIGIARENQERIFDRFTRLTSLTSYGGLGQGLFISLAIVRAHGGQIRVESELGRGSKFTVELPSMP